MTRHTELRKLIEGATSAPFVIDEAVGDLKPIIYSPTAEREKAGE